MSGPVQITLPWPCRNLWANRKAHWAAKAISTKKARGDAFYLMKEQVLRWLAEVDATSYDLTFSFTPPSGTGRLPDVHNMPATQKATIDGIADALGIDDAAITCHWPTKLEPRKGRGSVKIEVRPVLRASIGQT